MSESVDSGRVALLETTWERISADVLSHVMTLFLLVAVVAVPVPTFSMPSVDASALLNNPRFQVAEKLGLFLLLPVIVAVAVFAYALILRAAGRFLLDVSGIVIFVMFPRVRGLLTNEFVRWESLITIAG